MTQERIGFDAMNLAFTTYALLNVVYLILGCIYWSSTGKFNISSFWIGLVGSVISAIGIATLMKALSCGPIGPVLAVADGYPPLLAIIVAIKNQKMMSMLEIIALIIGLVGVMVISMPK